MALKFSFAQTDVSSVNDLTKAQLVQLPVGTEGPSSKSEIPYQFVRAFAQTSAASQTATIVLTLVDNSESTNIKLAQFTGTVTSTAQRADSAGTAGNYEATVSWAETSNSKLDLLGYGKKTVTASSNAVAGTPTVWYLGCTVLASGTMTVWLEPTRAI